MKFPDQPVCCLFHKRIFGRVLLRSSRKSWGKNVIDSSAFWNVEWLVDVAAGTVAKSGRFGTFAGPIPEIVAGVAARCAPEGWFPGTSCLDDACCAARV